jgi:hypothetical protein
MTIYIYVKGRVDYKNTNLKRRVWKEKARMLGLDDTKPMIT